MEDLVSFACHRVMPDAPELRPGVRDRDWMDRFAQRHPYRCLPLTMANSTGWELVCPSGFEAEWNGSPSQAGIQIHMENGSEPRWVKSHFGGGVLTFDAGYLMRTPPGWGMWVTGAPNFFKHGLAPMTGFVETDWLPFTFTMNWQFTAPGSVRFAAGEPYGFVIPMRLDALARTQPVISAIEDDPDVHAEYRAWRESRENFNQALADLDPEAIMAGWQKHYMRGQTVTGEKAHAHRSKRLLKRPVEGVNAASTEGT